MEVSSGVVRHNLPAVVLAGGSCNGLMPITSKIPKALIKIGNRTLLSYTLENLLRSGIIDIHIVSSNEHVDAIGQHVKMELATNLRIANNGPPNVVTYGLVVDTDGFFGSTDALRYMAGYVKGSFVLVPCDLYGSFDLSQLIRYHLSSKRLCTVALASDPTLSNKQNGKTSPYTLHDHNISIGGHGIRNFNYKYQIVATLDCDNDQLVEWANLMTVDSGEPYIISKWKSYRHPRCRIKMDLVDLHIYMFSERVFDIVSDSTFQHTSIRLDLIPYLIKNVETMRPVEAAENMPNGDILERTNRPFNENSDYSNDNNYLRVFGSTALGEYSLVRVSTLESFLYANMLRCTCGPGRVIPSSCNGSKVKDAIVGSNCLFLGRAIIKHSVIGNNASIGNGCRIANSVIMDDAIIEEGVVLEGSIIGKSSVVGANANLSKVVVAPGYRVQFNMHLENDFLPPFVVN